MSKLYNVCSGLLLFDPNVGNCSAAFVCYYAPPAPHRAEALSDDARLTSV